MKYYFVDLRALPISERIAACKKMEQYAWEVFEKVGTSGLESAEVCWTSPEDFEFSPCFPQGFRFSKIEIALFCLHELFIRRICQPCQ